MNSWVYGYKYRAVHSSQSPPPADAIDPVAVYYYPTRESSAESQMLCWLSAPGPTAAFKELYFKDGYGADLIDGKEVILKDISVIRQEHVGAKEIVALLRPKADTWQIGRIFSCGARMRPTKFFFDFRFAIAFGVSKETNECRVNGVIGLNCSDVQPDSEAKDIVPACRPSFMTALANTQHNPRPLPPADTGLQGETIMYFALRPYLLEIEDEYQWDHWIAFNRW
ncbi:hypothetical protein C8Q70DRAFT_333135 [Cubamyces menziesii]|nr:hypothetical protein C8Q70DRAFT_333135 [Cubamyces menziesii]